MADEQNSARKRAMVAVLWPNERDYAGFVAISADYMPPTVAEFRANLVNRAASKGFTEAQFIKIAGNANELARWCRDNGCPVDTNARAAYAALLVKAAHESREKNRAGGRRDN